MPQIKLGFDRVPVPTTTRLEELKNFPTGETLRDRTGNILYTEVDAPLRERAKTKNATSVYFNNDTDAPLKIEEQFPDTSEVSSTLLGIDRAETQLSLFSDVSSYGLNEEEFEYFNGFSLNIPRSWYRRNNATYGDHYIVNLLEETNEQALVVSSFPVPYTFPLGPEFEDRGYNEEIYAKYLNFIRLGNLLYDKFVEDGYQEFADKNFIPASLINAPTDDIKINYNQPESFETIFNQVGKWTYAWMDLRDNLLMDPRYVNTKLEYPGGFSTDNTLPGNASDNPTEAVLQTRKAYRYQPGRISGFTFGFKCSFDPTSTQNIIEWGVANDTDMYMFQVRGSKFSIVRRSTIPLPSEILNTMGFTVQDQESKENPTPFVDNQIFELAISQDFFNGDTMDGNGPSGYNLDVTKVTMYKVEFGWYGAIGARFLAYVPTGNGECRWVVLHTLVIENGIGEPCLNDPYFKFKYILNLQDTSNLRAPQFLYKYGASCYIDGGDDNSGTVYSYQSAQRISSSSTQQDINNDGSLDVDDLILARTTIGSAILGIQPKGEIFNSDGTGIKNKRDTFIEDLKVITDALTKIEIVEISGCPGFGHSYSPSLLSNQTGKTRSTLSFSLDRSELQLANDETFDDIQDGAHLIGPGLSGLYLQKKTGQAVNNTAFLKSISPFNNPGQEKFNTKIEETLLVNGAVIPYSDYFVNGNNIRFSEYNAFAASDSPLTGHTIKVNFLNPVKSVGNHIPNFFIGVTQDKPKQAFIGASNEVILTDRNTNEDKVVNLDDIFFVDYTLNSVLRNEVGQAIAEIPPEMLTEPLLLGMDFRIPKVEGDDSGFCSQVVITEEDKLSLLVTYKTNLSGPDYVGEPNDNYLVFNLRPDILINATKITGGEIGLPNNSGVPESSGVFFTSEIIINEYIDENGIEVVEYGVKISTLPDVETTSFNISLSPIKMADKSLVSEVFFGDFDFKPLYVIIGLRDNAEINTISIEEIRNDGKRSFVPNWITNDNITLRFPGGSSAELPVANFNSSERLSGNAIDIQTRQPLRPGKVITSLYVHPDNLELIYLNNIYGADRQVIAPGDINSKATFITAQSLDTSSVNNIIVSLVTREI